MTVINDLKLRHDSNSRLNHDMTVIEDLMLRHDINMELKSRQDSNKSLFNQDMIVTEDF